MSGKGGVAAFSRPPYSLAGDEDGSDSVEGAGRAGKKPWGGECRPPSRKVKGPEQAAEGLRGSVAGGTPKK